MRIGSLFSGAGGLDMAVEEVFGGTVVWHSEIDKAASKVLAYRWPDVPNLGSITGIEWAAVEPVDVLCGGFPCQDVSAAGKRAGIKDGTRSGLWAVFAEAIDILRPPIVVIENVRGLLSAAAHRMEPDEATVGDGAGRPVLRAAGAVLGDLADLRYDAQWCTVASADIGAPHRRERVFIVAHRGGIAADAGYGDDAERSWAQRRKAGERASVRTVARCGSEDAAVRGDGHGVDVPLLPTPVVNDMGDGKTVEQWDQWTAAMRAKHGNGNGHGASLAIEVQRGDGHGVDTPLLPTPVAQQSGNSPEEHLRHKPGCKVVTDLAILVENGLIETGGELLPTPNASDASGGGQHPDKREGHSRQLIDYVLLCTPSASDGAGGKTSRSGGRIDEPLLGGQAREMATAWGKYEPAMRRWENLTRPAPAPTEPNKNGNPRLSAAFSEWLMGWPAGWVTDPNIGISRNDQLRIVGNGVCPQQAAAAVRFLLEAS